MLCRCGSRYCDCTIKCQCETYDCPCPLCNHLRQRIIICEQCGFAQVCCRCALQNKVVNKCECRLHGIQEVCCGRPVIWGIKKKSLETTDSSVAEESSEMDISGPNSSEASSESDCQFPMDDLDSLSQQSSAALPRKTSPENILSTEKNAKEYRLSKKGIGKSHAKGCSTNFFYPEEFHPRSRNSSESSSSIEVIPEDKESSFETSRTVSPCNLNVGLLSFYQSIRPSIEPQDAESVIEPQDEGSVIEPQDAGSLVELLAAGSVVELQVAGSVVELQAAGSLVELQAARSLVDLQAAGSLVELQAAGSLVEFQDTGSSLGSSGSSFEHMPEDLSDKSMVSSPEHRSSGSVSPEVISSPEMHSLSSSLEDLSKQS